MRFQYLERVTDKKAKPLTKEVLEQLISDTAVEVNVERARMYLEQGDKETYSRYKALLPAAMWVGCNADGERRAEMLEPTQFYMIDIDHIEKTLPSPPVEGGSAMQGVSQYICKVFKEKIEPRCEELGIVLAHVTPSGCGLRIVARAVKDFPTVKEHMDWLVQELGLDKYGDYDSACKDFSRLSFVVGKNDIIYYVENLWDEPTHKPIKSAYNEEGENEKKASGSAASDAKGVGKVESENGSADEYEQELETLRKMTYHGFLLTEIAEKYVNKLGKPEQGERHNFYNRLVSDFRSIANNEWKVLFAVLPDFGLPSDERQKQCKGITRSTTLRQIPRDFYFFLKDNGYYQVKERVTAEAKQILEMEETQTDVPIPSKLPPVFREFVSCAPKDFKWPAIFALAPIIGTQTSYLRSTYMDGHLLTTTFFNIIYAPAGSGKSFCQPYIEKLFELTKIRDVVAGMREAIYLRNKKGDDSAKNDPHVSKRIMAAINSQPEFLSKMRDNKGYHMFTFAEEVDTFVKGSKAAGGDKTDMLRVAWDNGEYGQDFKSANTFKGSVRMFYNILLTGTPAQIDRCFQNIENGMITRFSFCPILNQEFAEMPIFKKLNAKQREAIESVVQMWDENTYREAIDFTVEEAEQVDEKDFDTQIKWKYTFKDFQEIDLSWLWPHLQKWQKEKLSEAMLARNHAKDTFRRRTARMGGSLALACYGLWAKVGEKEKEIIKDFVIAYMEKDLQERIKVFGEKYNELMNDQARKALAQTVRHNASLYDELPDEFDKTDIMTRCQRLGIFSPVKHIVSRWKIEGWVEKVGTDKWKKVDPTKKKRKLKR
ncbi:MAG: DUF3987 domain-containing protein [Prevotellaceae bacterium]|nr:DUF3987 domain-containing protein [Candidatus Minthosoma equi]